MARNPLWVKIETVGVLPSGNMGIRVKMRWWAVPYLVLVSVWRFLAGQFEDIPDSCDGVEVVE